MLLLNRWLATKRKRTRRSLSPVSTELLEARVLLSADIRSIDGSGNNLAHPEWGQAGTQLLRNTTVGYSDGVSSPAGADRPNARVLSNAIASQQGSIPNNRDLTSMVFQWGQFLDHDLDATSDAVPTESLNITVPADDPDLNPNVPIPMRRALYDPSTGTSVDNPRQQVNQITAYIDGSQIYGSDEVRARALRTLSGGALKTSHDGQLLPYNFLVDGQPLPNGGPPPLSFDEYFVAGDVRSNEQPGLAAMHTLFVREHNRLAEEIAATEFAGANLSDPAVDEAIYQQARMTVIAELQAITYNEFLPALLGPDGVAPYTGYNPNVNAGVDILFSAAMFRVGHTMLPSELMRLTNDGQVIPDGNISLGEGFFQPSLIGDYGIEPYLKGLSVQRAQEIDNHVVDDVRNLLFAPPAQFDLAATNIQRGRDVGLPNYNQARIDLGLAPVTSFAEITSDPELQQALETAYGGDVNNIDVWLGGISEDHVPGSSLGELMRTAIAEQFQRTRDGDRFYYENILTGADLAEIQNTRLSDIIRRNSGLTNLQTDVFRTESVLTVELNQGPRGADVTLRLTAPNILVVNNRNGRILESHNRQGISRIVVVGSNGNDRLVIDPRLGSAPLPIEIQGWTGMDMLQLNGTVRGDEIHVWDSHSLVNGAEVAFGSWTKVAVSSLAGNDFVSAAFRTRPILIDGGAGNDILRGGFAGDTLLGGAGLDLMLGGQGNDLLRGGAGRDMLIGGDGNDRLFGDAGDDILVGGRGVDQLNGGAGADVAIPDRVAQASATLRARFLRNAGQFFRLSHINANRLSQEDRDQVLQG